MKKKRIVICGNYGATNLGDEALLEGILHLVRRSVPNPSITVLSVNPDETADVHSVESARLMPAGFRSWWNGIRDGGTRKTMEVVRKADLFILGGGGLFTDEKLRAVFIWTLQAWAAKRRGVPIFCLGQSVGPLRTWLGRWLTRKVFGWAEVVTVRDRDSALLLERLGIGDVKVLADPAFALDSSSPLNLDREDYVVLSVRPWITGDSEVLHKRLAKFVDWLWQKHALRTVLVPFQVSFDNDVEALQQILAHVEGDSHPELFDYSADYHQVFELMARSQALIGMRLHSLIFSSLTHTPFVGLSYSAKVRQFSRQIGMEEFILDWPDFDLDNLQERFEKVVLHRDELSEQLDEAVMKQRKKALGHEELLQRVLSL